jgi:hypothetical protein
MEDASGTSFLVFFWRAIWRLPGPRKAVQFILAAVLNSVPVARVISNRGIPCSTIVLHVWDKGGDN